MPNDSIPLDSLKAGDIVVCVIDGKWPWSGPKTEIDAVLYDDDAKYFEMASGLYLGRGSFALPTRRSPLAMPALR